MSSSHWTRNYWGIALVLLTLIGITMFGASPAVGAGATSNTLYSGDVGPSMVFATNTDPVARCSVSETSVQVGESVTIDASESVNADDYQYDKSGNEAFGEYTTQRSRTVSYSEPGTYDPQVKVWSYSDGETSDVAACGSITVTEPTPTPTPTPTATPTPSPSAVAKCTVSETSVQVGESVTIDASESENVDDYQYDKYGDSSFGEYTTQRSRTVSYSEPGTYEPRVKVWSYSGGEDSDVAACGTVTVTEPTPTATPTPTPSAVAKCTVSETSVQVDESVTIDASESENADDYQYDKYGGSSFGEYTAQSSRVVAYSEPGTYEPRVKVWSYSGGEDSDVAACGTITVTEPTPTPTPTPTTTPTPAPGAVAKCTISETSIQVGDSVTIGASESENADDYQYDKYGGASFGEFTSQSSRVVAYSEPGTYEPRVKVWSYSGGEDSDVAACGTITVTESTPTATPNPTSTATPTQADSEASISSTRTSTPVPTATAAQTPGSTTGTATDGEAWFRYSPSDPSANDSVRLVAQPAVAQDDVEAHSWDIDGDGTVDQHGRVLELPAKRSGETTVTLTIERTNGSTASVTREVPITPDLAGETVTPEQPATGTDGGIPIAALLALLLVLIVAVIAWSRMDR